MDHINKLNQHHYSKFDVETLEKYLENLVGRDAKNTKQKTIYQFTLMASGEKIIDFIDTYRIDENGDHVTESKKDRKIVMHTSKAGAKMFHDVIKAEVKKHNWY